MEVARVEDKVVDMGAVMDVGVVGEEEEGVSRSPWTLVLHTQTRYGKICPKEIKTRW